MAVNIALVSDPQSFEAILARNLTDTLGLDIPLTEDEVGIFIVQALWEIESREHHPAKSKYLTLVIDDD